MPWKRISTKRFSISPALEKLHEKICVCNKFYEYLEDVLMLFVGKPEYSGKWLEMVPKFLEDFSSLEVLGKKMMYDATGSWTGNEILSQSKFGACSTSEADPLRHFGSPLLIFLRYHSVPIWVIFVQHTSWMWNAI